MEPIRLILVDDHDVVRAGLRAFLDNQEGIRVIGEAASGEEALRVARELRPDVVVMDITMAGMDGLEATRRLRTVCPECKVLALTVHEDKQYFFAMMAAGAVGYVTKQAAAEELVHAVRAVFGGHVYLQPALARWLLEDYRRLVSKSPREGEKEWELEAGDQELDVLSDREQQVLELVAEGLTSPQIGETLGISPKTVARHRERIMNKLNMHSAAELVKFAIRSGLIDIN